MTAFISCILPGGGVRTSREAGRGSDVIRGMLALCDVIRGVLALCDHAKGKHQTSWHGPTDNTHTRTHRHTPLALSHTHIVLTSRSNCLKQIAYTCHKFT